jgi:hypothetical protein
MGRVLGLPLLLVSLVVGGYLFVAQSRSKGPAAPAAPAATLAESQAESMVAGTNFQAADAVLQAWFAGNATYAGATLPPGSGVVLVRADASAYCLQTGAGSALEHELGPGGQPQPGPC